MLNCESCPPPSHHHILPCVRVWVAAGRAGGLYENQTHYISFYDIHPSRTLGKVDGQWFCAFFWRWDKSENSIWDLAPLSALGGISPYMSIMWQQPVGIGLSTEFSPLLPHCTPWPAYFYALGFGKATRFSNAVPNCCWRVNKDLKQGVAKTGYGHIVILRNKRSTCHYMTPIIKRSIHVIYNPTVPMWF